MTRSILNGKRSNGKRNSKKTSRKEQERSCISFSVRQLLEADKLKLQNRLEGGVHTYLITEEHLSILNQRSVMRQVEKKLAAGVVKYKRWGSNVFMQGTTVDYPWILMTFTNKLRT
jgi:hypothetical protein